MIVIQQKPSTIEFGITGKNHPDCSVKSKDVKTKSPDTIFLHAHLQPITNNALITLLTNYNQETDCITLH